MMLRIARSWSIVRRLAAPCCRLAATHQHLPLVKLYPSSRVLYSTSDEITPYSGAPFDFSDKAVSFPTRVEQSTSTPAPVFVDIVELGKVRSEKQRELYGLLKKLHSDDLLATVAMSYGQMDKIHFALALKRLEVVRLHIHPDRQQQFVDDTFVDDRFQVLVALVTSKARFYNADLQFHILCQLLMFGFHDDHPAVMTFLQLLRHNINQLSLDQLLHLYDMVTPLTDSDDRAMILEAVHALLPSRGEELKLLDASEAILFLTYFHDELKHKQIQFLLHVIQKELLEAHLHHEEAYLLLWLLCGTPNLLSHSHDRSVTWNWCRTRIVKACHQNRDVYQLQELSHILQCMVTYFCAEHTIQSISDIIDSACDKIDQTDDSDYRDGLKLMSTLCQKAFYHQRLFERVEMTIDPDTVDTDDILNWLVCCWSLHYKFQDVAKLQQGLQKIVDKLTYTEETLSKDDATALALLLTTWEDHDVPIPTHFGNLWSTPDESSQLSDPDRLESETEKHIYGDPNYSDSESSDISQAHTTEHQNAETTNTSNLNHIWSCGLQHAEIVPLLTLSLVQYMSGNRPGPLQDDHSVNIRKEKVSEDHESFLEELKPYLQEAFPDYHMSRNLISNIDLSADFELTRNPELPKAEGDLSDSRIAVKLWPDDIVIRNHTDMTTARHPRHQVKEIVNIYTACLRSQQYKLIMFDGRGVWHTIPSDEKSSFLNNVLDCLNGGATCCVITKSSPSKYITL